jgi:hypothetical protein
MHLQQLPDRILRLLPRRDLQLRDAAIQIV